MIDASSVLPSDAAPEVVLAGALAQLGRGRAVAIATVLVRHGSAPSTPGQKLALALGAGGASIELSLGTVGGGAVERAVVGEMLRALAAEASPPRVHTFRLGPSLGMCCGGSADILVEVMTPRRAALIVGAGHVGLATAKLLAELSFRVVLVDAREAASDEARTRAAREAGVTVVPGDHDDPAVLEAVGAPEPAIAIAITHDHQLDQQVIEWALGRAFGYVGGVGSRAKAERTRQRLEARGFSAADRARVRMPIGVSVGARKPLEIAVAIAAELVAHRAQLEAGSRASSDAKRAEGETAASSASFTADSTGRSTEAVGASSTVES